MRPASARRVSLRSSFKGHSAICAQDVKRPPEYQAGGQSRFRAMGPSKNPVLQTLRENARHELRDICGELARLIFFTAKLPRKSAPGRTRTCDPRLRRQNPAISSRAVFWPFLNACRFNELWKPVESSGTLRLSRTTKSSTVSCPATGPRM